MKVIINIILFVIIIQFAGSIYSSHNFYLPVNSYYNSKNPKITLTTQSNNRNFTYSETQSSNGSNQRNAGWSCLIQFSGAVPLQGGGTLQWGIAFQDGRPVAAINITLPLNLGCGSRISH